MVKVIPTFTCHNRYIFIMDVHGIIHRTPDSSREFFRRLSVPERLRVQGFATSLAMDLSPASALKAAGNAYPVPCESTRQMSRRSSKKYLNICFPSSPLLKMILFNAVRDMARLANSSVHKSCHKIWTPTGVCTLVPVSFLLGAVAYVPVHDGIMTLNSVM